MPNHRGFKILRFEISGKYKFIFRTADDRLQGKELDSLRRYKERRKKRIQETNNNTPSESDLSIHGKFYMHIHLLAL